MKGDEWNSERERQQRILDRETGYRAPDERQVGLREVLNAFRRDVDGWLDDGMTADQYDRFRAHTTAIMEVALEHAALAVAQVPAQESDEDTETCPTCWQPVPRPQRGDHDYGLPLVAQVPAQEEPDSGLDEFGNPAGYIEVPDPDERQAGLREALRIVRGKDLTRFHCPACQVELVDDLTRALAVAQVPAPLDANHEDCDEQQGLLTPSELEVLPKMRLDLDRFTAYSADDVRMLLDIIDRQDRALR